MSRFYLDEIFVSSADEYYQVVLEGSQLFGHVFDDRRYMVEIMTDKPSRASAVLIPGYKLQWMRSEGYLTDCHEFDEAQTVIKAKEAEDEVVVHCDRATVGTMRHANYHTKVIFLHLRDMKDHHIAVVDDIMDKNDPHGHWASHLIRTVLYTLWVQTRQGDEQRMNCDCNHPLPAAACEVCGHWNCCQNIVYARCSYSQLGYVPVCDRCTGRAAGPNPLVVPTWLLRGVDMMWFVELCDWRLSASCTRTHLVHHQQYVARLRCAKRWHRIKQSKYYTHPQSFQWLKRIDVEHDSGRLTSSVCSGCAYEKQRLVLRVSKQLARWTHHRLTSDLVDLVVDYM